jgi:hypothetical protein
MPDLGAAENEHFGSMAPFPASSFELRSVAFRLRIAKTEVSEKTPSFWHVQHLVDAARSENRDPAHSYAVGGAASHIVWIAVTTEYSTISGIVLRPRPCPISVVGSAKIAIWQGASSSPANLSFAY